MSVAGNWARSAAVFNPSGSTVTFNGSSPDLIGSTTFYGLASTIPNQAMTFQAGSTTGVTGFLTIAGTAGNLIDFRSSSPGTRWSLINTGTNTVSFVDTQDSDASWGRTIRAMTGGVDSGNNLNWTFTDAYRYWASAVTSVWNSTNSWSFTSGGSIGASPPASSHTVVFDGADGYVGVSSMNAVVNISTLSITSGYSGTLNTIGSALTISSAIVQTGGTISLGTSVVTLQGDLNLSGGTFQPSQSTTTLSGTKNQSLSSNFRRLGHLLVNKAGGTASLTDGMGLEGHLTVTLGTLDTDGYSISVGSNVLINGGTLTLDNSTMTVTRGWTRSSGSFNRGGSTVTFDGANASNINIGTLPFQNVIFNGSGSVWTLTSALFNNGYTTLTNGTLNTGNSFNVTVGSGIYLNGGTFQTNRSSITVLGNWNKGAGQFHYTGSTVSFTGPSASTLTGSTSFYALTCTTPNQQLFFEDGSLQSVINMFTMAGSAGNPIVLRSVGGSEWDLSITTGQSVSYVDVQDSDASGGATVRAFTGGVDSGSNLNWAFNDRTRYWASAVNAVWNSTNSWSLSSGGTGNAPPPSSTHTVVLDGSNGKVGVSSVNTTVSISTLVVTSGYSGSLNTQGFGVTITSGIFQTGGTINLSSSAVGLTGALNLTGGTFTAGMSTFTLTGSSSQTLTATSGSLANLVLNKTAGTVALGNNLSLNGAFTLTAGTFTTGNPGFQLTVSSDIRQTGGTWTMNGSTISFSQSWARTAGNMNDMTSVLTLLNGNTQTLNLGTTSFYHLTINKSAGGVTLSNNLDIDGDLTLQSGTFTPGSRTIDVAGNWTNSGGTFNGTSSTVTFNSGNVQTISGNTSFDIFRSTQSGNTLRFQNGDTTTVTRILELRNATIESTSAGSAWLFNVSATSRTLLNLSVQDSDASLGVLLISTGSTNVSGNVNWDFGPPNAIAIFTVTQSTQGAALELDWDATGDDASVGTLNNSTFTVQYTTVSAFAFGSSWSPTTALPANVYRVTIATNSVTAGSGQGQRLTGLISGGTTYLRIWTLDDADLYSPLSIGATNWAMNALYSLSQSGTEILLGSLTAGTTVVHSSSITVTNIGNIDTTYQVSLTTPATWVPTISGAGADQFRLTGVFKNTLPVSSDFSVSDDVITGSTVTATANTFAVNTDGSTVKGISVPPGESRGLWFRIEMPPASSTEAEQTIRINVTAGP